MQIIKLTKSQFTSHRQKLVQFLLQHGDKRITKKAIDWIKKASSEDIEQEGFLALSALENKTLIGVLIVADYGMDESIVAVHEKYRNQNTAKKMVYYTIAQLGKVYGRVALDNIPSLKICLENGMVGFHLFTGVTKKPTLWLGGGNWKKEDVLDKVPT